MTQSAHKDIVLRTFDDQGRAIRFETPNGSVVPLAAIVFVSGAPVTVSGTTAETTMASLTIPANTLGVTGTIVVFALWSHTNNANTKTKRVKLGSFDFANAHQETTTASSRDYYSMHQRTTTTQVAYNTSGFGNSAGAVLTGNIDTTVDQTLTITGQLQSGTSWVGQYLNPTAARLHAPEWATHIEFRFNLDSVNNPAGFIYIDEFWVTPY